MDEASDENDTEGYPTNLIVSTERALTVQWGRAPSREEIIKHLDQINEQIHEANREIAENLPLMKQYYQEGNFEAMKTLQQNIFLKHVKRLPPLEVAADDMPADLTKEERDRFHTNQLERRLEQMKASPQ